MLSYEDLRDAAAGEERDALMRAFAEDRAEASGRGRGKPGFVRAEPVRALVSGRVRGPQRWSPAGPPITLRA